MSAAIAGPALTAMKANAQSGACAPDNVAAHAALFDRYVAAVNAGDTAAPPQRFGVGFTNRQKVDLVNFLNAL